MKPLSEVAPRLQIWPIILSSSQSWFFEHFSQQLALPLRSDSKTIFDIKSCDDLLDAPINTDNHCYGCAAGKGSSWLGTLSSA